MCIWSMIVVHGRVINHGPIRGRASFRGRRAIITFRVVIISGRYGAIHRVNDRVI